jgi:hypothetical protein
MDEDTRQTISAIVINAVFPLPCICTRQRICGGQRRPCHVFDEYGRDSISGSDTTSICSSKDAIHRAEKLARENVVANAVRGRRPRMGQFATRSAYRRLACAMPPTTRSIHVAAGWHGMPTGMQPGRDIPPGPPPIPPKKIYLSYLSDPV